MADLSPNAAAAFDQIAVESRESFAGIARTRAMHYEETSTALSQVGTTQQGIYGALATGILTGSNSPQANAETALKQAAMYPIILNPATQPNAVKAV